MFTKRTAAASAIALSIGPTLMAQHTLRTVLYDGQQAPGMSPGVHVSLTNTYTPALNNAGQIAVYTGLTGPDVPSGTEFAWYTGDPDNLSLFARRGDPAPGSPGATFFSLGRLILNDHNDAAMPAALNSATASGLWIGRAGSPLASVAATGKQATSLPAGVTYNIVTGTVSPFAYEPAFNSRGEVGFLASFQGPGFSGLNYGLWVGPPDSLRLAARVLAPAPGAPAGHQFLNLSSIALSPSGQAAFAGYSATFGGNTGLNGIWTHTSNTELVVRVSEHVPSYPTGVVFNGPIFVGFTLDSTWWPALNNAGSVGFISNIAGPGIDGSTGALGWWAGTRATIAQLARASDPIPSLPGTTIAQVINGSSQMQMNASGAVAFDVVTSPSSGSASLVGPPAPPSGPDAAVVLATGMPAPGFDPSITIASTITTSINDAGDVVILAFIRGPGISTSNDAVLYVGHPGDVQRLLRESDEYTLPKGATKIISQISVSRGCAGQDGHPFSFDNAGRIIARLTFTDTSRAIVLIEPTPPCAADYDHSGAVDSADFFAFLFDFFGEDTRADFNRSGRVDSQDFFDFLAAFFVPCG